MTVEQAQAILYGMAAALDLPVPPELQASLIAGYLHQDQPEPLKNLPVEAGASAYLAALALKQVDPSQWLTQLFTFIEGRSDALEMVLRRVGHVEGWVDQVAALQHIARGQEPAAAQVAQVLYCLRQYPDDYRSAIALALKSEFPSIVALLVGGISAARLGLAAVAQTKIPENYEELLKVAQRLAIPR